MRVEDRKVQVLEVAMDEYGRHGMHATSTERIAELAGVSQPYLFRLFGTKVGLISAAIEQHAGRLRQAFRDAAEQRAPDVTPLDAMALAFVGLMERDANALRCQLHTWAAASDPALHAVARRTYREVWATIVELSGADDDEIRDFMAQGMLLTVLGSLDLMDLYGDPRQTIGAAS